MIAAWMLYTVGVSFALFVGARAVEFLARAAGAATRWVWACALVAALGLSANALAHPAPASRAKAIVDTSGRQVVRVPRVSVPVRSATTSAQVTSLLASVERVDTTRLDRWNTLLVALWLAATAAAFLYLAVGVWRVRRMARGLRPHRLDDHDVLVSRDVGPALFGILEPRIVIPEWVLELDVRDRRVILAHEKEHAEGGDPALLVAASLVLAAQVWNPALWVMFARLRLSIETDCDRRVLRARRDVRHYGGLLVMVYERVSPRFASPIAFAERPSNLERRIRRMTEAAPRLASLTGIAAVCTAAVVLTVAWVTPAPARHTTTLVDGPRVATGPRPRRVGQPDRTGKSGVNPVVVTTPAPSSLPRFARGGDVCGFGTSVDARCASEADVLIRVVDTTRVIVALREHPGMLDQVEHVFFVQSREPIPDRLSRAITMAHVEYENGEISIASPTASEPPTVFGGRVETAARDPGAMHYTNLIGISHYSPGLLPFDDVPRVARLDTCDVAGHVCYSAGGRPFVFP